MHEYHLGLKRHCFENAFQKKLHSFSFWYTLYFTLQDLSVGLINLHRWLLNDQMIKSILQSVLYKNMVWLCVCCVITMQARNLVHSEQTHLYCFFSRLFKNQLFTECLKAHVNAVMGLCVIHITYPRALIATSNTVHSHRSLSRWQSLQLPIRFFNQAHPCCYTAQTGRNNVTCRLRDDPQGNPHTL